MSRLELNSHVEFIIKTLNERGYRADVVGGPVRDFLRGVTPSDYDITTSAAPKKIKEVFSEFRTVDTGIRHGTVTLIIDRIPYEITTYRIDGEYLDARHPAQVKFTDELEEDLARRDFTVNAIAYNPSDGITDPFGGRADIEAKIIRAVGDPYIRFSEDALRILRGLRFSACLGFSIEENTAKALREKSHLLKEISKERIYTEWKKLLSGDFANSVIAEFSDVISVFLPELGKIKLPKRFADDFIVREAQLFYLSAENPRDAFESAMYRLKTDTATRTLGIKILESAGKYRLKTLEDAGVMLMNLGDAARATAMLDVALGKTDKAGYALLSEYTEKGLAYRLCDLDVSGRDITALGVKGEAVGRTLSTLLSLVVSGNLKNEKDTLISYVKNANYVTKQRK